MYSPFTKLMTANDLRIGFGTAVITPDVPVFLAGFGARTAPAEVVHDDLEARAVFVDDAGGGLCLVVCDLLGMSADVALAVRSAIGDAVALPLERVITACTHTHSGPSVLSGAERLGWPTPPGYEESLAVACGRAARAARDAAEPASLLFARAPLPPSVSLNRRALPYDPTFAVLTARRPDGTTIGTIANVGVHPVALDAHCLAVSADWVRPFRSAVEAASGGVAVLLQGALGDVNPPEAHEHEAGGDFAHAGAVGRGIADAVVAALEAVEPVATAAGEAAVRTIRVPLSPTPVVQLLGMDGEVEVELVEWSIGELRVVSVPGEAFHAFGRAVESARPGRVLLAGLAPAWHGYLPVPFGDGYEETVSYGEPAVAAILDALCEQP
jgi:neutral ceramidase